MEFKLDRGGVVYAHMLFSKSPLCKQFHVQQLGRANEIYIRVSDQEGSKDHEVSCRRTCGTTDALRGMRFHQNNEQHGRFDCPLTRLLTMTTPTVVHHIQYRRYTLVCVEWRSESKTVRLRNSCQGWRFRGSPSEHRDAMSAAAIDFGLFASYTPAKWRFLHERDWHTASFGSPYVRPPNRFR